MDRSVYDMDTGFLRFNVMVQPKQHHSFSCAQESTLYRYKEYSANDKVWSDWICVPRPVSQTSAESSRVGTASIPAGHEIPCTRGRITVYPKVLSSSDRHSLHRELADCNFFRAYPIQGGTEPRRHFLAHELADHNEFAFDSPVTLQPGYRYSNNSITLKARSLAKLPRLSQLSDAMKRYCNVPQWTIGINPVCYRNHSDSISPHADDNQGETLIVAVVVYQEGEEASDEEVCDQKNQDRTPQQRNMVPTTRLLKRNLLRRRRRVVKIEPQRPNELVQGDVMVQLFLNPGDAYAMDGELQQHYYHSVPKVAARGTCINAEIRLAVIFRCGKISWVSRDTGTPSDWKPRPPLRRIFGRCGIPGLVEGNTYTKSQLFKIGAHEQLQKGVSGTKAQGCNAIALSGLRSDAKGDNKDFSSFVWFVELWNGGAAMLKSAQDRLPIRVFRSSDLNSVFRALVIAHHQTKSFRYDGLYEIIFAGYECGERTVPVSLDAADIIHSHPLANQNTIYCFQLRRIEKGPGPMQNELSDLELAMKCLRSRVMSLPSPWCPCRCKESRLCRFLSQHSDQQLCDYFLSVWNMAPIPASIACCSIAERAAILRAREVFIRAGHESFQLAPRMLHLSAKARRKRPTCGDVQRNSHGEADGAVDSVSIASAMPLPTQHQSISSPNQSSLVIDGPKKRRSPKRWRQDSCTSGSKIDRRMAIPGEQVAAYVQLMEKSSFNKSYPIMEWILAVVERYDSTLGRYVVRDIVARRHGRGSAQTFDRFSLTSSHIVRLSRICSLSSGSPCWAIYPNSTVFYPAIKVRRSLRSTADPGTGFQLLQFQGEDGFDDLGCPQLYKVLNQYVLQIP